MNSQISKSTGSTRAAVSGRVSDDEQLEQQSGQQNERSKRKRSKTRVPVHLLSNRQLDNAGSDGDRRKAPTSTRHQHLELYRGNESRLVRRIRINPISLINESIGFRMDATVYFIAFWNCKTTK